MLNIDLTSAAPALLAKLAAAGVLAVAASVMATHTLHSDVQTLATAVQELKVEVHEMRRDLYSPRTTLAPLPPRVTPPLPEHDSRNP